MKVRPFGIFIGVICLLSSWTAKAQSLPVMPQDPAVQTCVFSNGLSCYAVGNASTKGVADITLVRRDYTGNDLVSAHRNVMISSEVAVDSMLLGMMRRVEKDGIPADCAVIVSGDIDTRAVMTKLKYMSLMVDSSEPSMMPEVAWEGDGKIRFSVNNDMQAGLAVVNCSWHASRVSSENMHKTLGAIYEKTAWELGEVACVLIRRGLRKADIPCAEVSYRYDNAPGNQSYESFSFDVIVAAEDAEAAMDMISSALASIDRGDIVMNDVLLAEKSYLDRLERNAGKVVVGNDEYTGMCRNAFLYGTPLVSDRERLAFFRSKDVSLETRRKIFTDISSAMIEMDALGDSTECVASGVMLSDTLALPGPSEDKMKTRLSRKDAFSGGSMWTFANGFKVVYHKMPSTGMRLYYSLSLGSGYGNVPDLERGEGAYMSEYLDNCWIAGMKGSYFRELLNLSGMTMDTKVNLFSTVISGQVEDRNAALLMKSLLAVANECRPDHVEIDYHARCESMRQEMLSGSDAKAVIDSVMCPGYKYSSFKAAGGVREETFAKAEALFSSMMSKMNDGLLVIVGDMDEATLKKQLQYYVGGFRVRNVASRRPSLKYSPVSGWLTYKAEGDRYATMVVVTAPFAMTASNHFATEIVALYLERRLKDIFESKGVQVRLSLSRNIYPDERFSILVELSGKCCQEDLTMVHEVLNESKVSEQELSSCKEYLKTSYALQADTPAYWLRVVPLRHLEGKDFTTGASAKIEAVSQDDLKSVFKALAEGAGMEYITIKK